MFNYSLNGKPSTFSFFFILVNLIGNECIDTVGWNDLMNTLTCSDYATRGWCVNRTVISSMQNNPMAALNFPDLNCCVCGKKSEDKSNFRHIYRYE